MTVVVPSTTYDGGPQSPLPAPGGTYQRRTEMISAAGDGTYINVHVQPGARNSRIAGRHGDALKVSVREPPADGRANAAVAGILASWLGVAAENITLVSGRTSRRKRFFVAGIDPDAAARAVESVAGE